MKSQDTRCMSKVIKRSSSRYKKDMNRKIEQQLAFIDYRDKWLVEMAKDKNIPTDEIIEITGLTKEEIEKL